jgi:hypothetical protein
VFSASFDIMDCLCQVLLFIVNHAQDARAVAGQTERMERTTVLGDDLALPFSAAVGARNVAGHGREV